VWFVVKISKRRIKVDLETLAKIVVSTLTLVTALYVVAHGIVRKVTSRRDGRSRIVGHIMEICGWLVAVCGCAQICRLANNTYSTAWVTGLVITFILTRIAVHLGHRRLASIGKN